MKKIFFTIAIAYFLSANLYSSVLGKNIVNTNSNSQKQNSMTLKKPHENQSDNTFTFTWQKPLFVNLTSLKIYSVNISSKTLEKSSIAYFGNKSFAKANSFIGPEEEIRLDGNILFGVIKDNPSSNRETTITVTILAAGNKKDKFKITDTYTYPDQVDTETEDIWNTMYEFTPKSNSCIILHFNEKYECFGLQVEFMPKSKLYEKYILRLFMKYTRDNRELMLL